MSRRRQPCSIAGCTTRTFARGWCEKHYLALRDAPLCSVEGCETKIVARGLCNKHYMRVKRGGTTERRRARKCDGHLDGGGYRLLWQPEHPNARKAGHVSEHVLMMGDALGRPIAKGETVHHRNGIRDDNRLENLELWRSGHPPGQRISDHLAWALELLETYADDPVDWPDEVVERLTAVLDRLERRAP